MRVGALGRMQAQYAALCGEVAYNMSGASLSAIGNLHFSEGVTYRKLVVWYRSGGPVREEVDRLRRIDRKRHVVLSGHTTVHEGSYLVAVARFVCLPLTARYYLHRSTGDIVEAEPFDAVSDFELVEVSKRTGLRGISEIRRNRMLVEGLGFDVTQVY